MTKICWGYPPNHYHLDVDNGDPECGLVLDIERDIISIGDTDDAKSMSLVVTEECPRCNWPTNDPNQTDLFA